MQCLFVTNALISNMVIVIIIIITLIIIWTMLKIASICDEQESQEKHK